MKSPLFLVLLLALTTPLLSSEIPFNNCRDFTTKSSSNLSIIKLAEIDLLHGIWVKKNDKDLSQMTIQFNKSGLVDVIITAPKQEATYSHAHWRIEEQEGSAFLVWGEHDEKDRLLKINQVCEGIILTDFNDGSEYLLNYLPRLDSKRFDFVQKSLLGNWVNATYPYDLIKNEEDCGTLNPIEGAFLEYNFQKDGTYTKKWGSAKVEFTEVGSWNVSSDGNFLMMKAQDANNVHESEVTYLAQIKMLDMDKVVLAQSLHSPNLGSLYCTKNKDFFLVK
ncbi:MAG: hypothetical protein NXI23_23295 [Bacteroidetes bacterium]|jgi:hypothetical protein|nr:hypothetical protein [Bacteroidota bacterium]